jgi:hypothetical protein
MLPPMEECIPNIGPAERKKRVSFGTIAIVIGAALAAYLVLGGAPRPWRLAVLLPFWGGAVGLFQAFEKTCVALSARGVRNMDSGDEPMTNAEELKQVRAQARKVQIESFVAALVATALVALLPTP